jgi:predicted O-methyltransferase YrrM
MLGGKLSRSNARLVGKALRHLSRAVLRLVLRSRLSRISAEEDRRRLIAYLSDRFGVDGPALADEYLRSPFRLWSEQRRAALDQFRGPYRHGTTGRFGCEALYLLVRAARPQVVVDTGVPYGGSSSHILAALERNGAGALYSIELGRDQREPPHDYFVPADLRRRWSLILGDSRRELPALLSRLGTIDMFHHDSLHTWDHMTWEFETAYPHVRPDGVLTSDDILGAATLREVLWENAFPAFCRRHGVQYESFFNLGVGSAGSRRSESQPGRSASQDPPGYSRAVAG